MVTARQSCFVEHGTFVDPATVAPRAHSVQSSSGRRGHEPLERARQRPVRRGADRAAHHVAAVPACILLPRLLRRAEPRPAQQRAHGLGLVAAEEGAVGLAAGVEDEAAQRRVVVGRGGEAVGEGADRERLRRVVLGAGDRLRRVAGLLDVVPVRARGTRPAPAGSPGRPASCPSVTPCPRSRRARPREQRAQRGQRQASCDAQGGHGVTSTWSERAGPGDGTCGRRGTSVAPWHLRPNVSSS